MNEFSKGADIILKRGYMQNSARLGMPGTKDYSGLQLRFNLADDKIPILTTRHISFKMIMAELLWMLRGDTNIKYLVDRKCNIWNDNAYKWYCYLAKKYKDTFKGTCLEATGTGYPGLTQTEFIDQIINETAICDRVFTYNVDGEILEYRIGDLGRIYGYQWRKRKVDAIVNLIEGIRLNPLSRQHKVTAWVTEDMDYDHCAQPNCHGDFIINCRPLNGETRIKLLKETLKVKDLKIGIDEINLYFKKLNIPEYEITMNLNQRSGDYVLGVPFNIVSYSVLLHIIGLLTNTVPKMLVMTINNAHIYKDHIKDFKTQLERPTFASPTLVINDMSVTCYRNFCNETNPSLDALIADIDNCLNPGCSLKNYKHHERMDYKLHTGVAGK